MGVQAPYPILTAGTYQLPVLVREYYRDQRTPITLKATMMSLYVSEEMEIPFYRTVKDPNVVSTRNFAMYSSEASPNIGYCADSVLTGGKEVHVAFSMWIRGTLVQQDGKNYITPNMIGGGEFSTLYCKGKSTDYSYAVGVSLDTIVRLPVIPPPVLVAFSTDYSYYNPTITKFPLDYAKTKNGNDLIPTLDELQLEPVALSNVYFTVPPIQQ